MKYKLINETIEYNGKFIKVTNKEYQAENNQLVCREIVNHKQGVAILAFNGSQVYLVKQYRHAIEQEIYEVPAGVCEEGEDLLDCANRELQEEIGFAAKTWKKIATIYPSCGFTDELLTIYYATNLYPHKLALDDDEYLSVELVEYEKLLLLAKNQQITDAKTLIAILYYQSFINEQKHPK